VVVTPESDISLIIATSDRTQPLTIVLQPGVYRQNIVINRSNVTVRGATGLVGDAVVVGAETGAPVQVTSNAAGVVLENFSILNTRSLAPIEYGINAEEATEVTVTGVDIVLSPTGTPPASRGVAIGFGSAAAGVTSKNLTVTRSNLFVAGAANSAGIRIAGDNAGINLRVEMGSREALIRPEEPPLLLVVEVVSESSRAADYRAKRAEYCVLGIGEYWIVDPLEEKVSLLLLHEGWYDVLELKGSDPVSSKVFPKLELQAGEILAADSGYSGKATGS
jgi:hypothetical protein